MRMFILGICIYQSFNKGWENYAMELSSNDFFNFRRKLFFVFIFMIN